MLPGLKPNTSSASSSLPIHTSTYFISLVITFCAFSLVHSFLRKFDNEKFIQADEFDVNYGGGEANVAVSCANYGHSAALKIASKSKSFAVAVVIEE